MSSDCTCPVDRSHTDGHAEECPRANDGYNGWPNHATWCVQLHLSNDEWLYHAMNDAAMDACLRNDDVYGVVQALQYAAEELLQPAGDDVPMGAVAIWQADACRAMLQDVSWERVAAAWCEGHDSLFVRSEWERMSRAVEARR